MYNDEQLKQALAQMLPEKIAYEDVWLFWKRWPEKALGQHASRKVLDTELLHLCWLVEETLDKIGDESEPPEILGIDIEWNQYTERLWNQFDGTPEDGSLWAIVHATWQQRTIALAQVKGVEIV